MFQQYAIPPQGLIRTLLVVLAGIFLASLSSHLRAESAAEKRHEAVLKELELTPSEEKLFWPIYDAYTRDLLDAFEATAEVAYKLFRERGSINDDMADEYTSALLNGELRRAQLHLQYQPRFRKILDGRKTARLFQFERRLYTYMNAEISRDFPLLR